MLKKLNNPTLKEFMDTTWIQLEANNGENKKTTEGFNLSMSKRITEYFKDEKLKEISSNDIEFCLKYHRTEYRQRTGKIGMEPKTVKHLYSILNRVFKYAKREHYISENPMDFVKPPRVPRKEVEALSESELRTLIEALPTASDDVRCMLIVLITTGIRRGELVGLHFEDVDFEKQLLHVKRNVTRATGSGVVIGTPKTSRSNRSIPLSENTLKVLEEYEQQERLKFPDKDLQKAFIFHSKKDLYYPCEPTAITHKVRNFMDKIGLRSYSPHDLRHTFASLILEHGGDIKSLQNLLGHENASTTLNSYVRANMEQMRKASTKFTSAFDL